MDLRHPLLTTIEDSKKGSPLSPYLFLLVIEGLSRLIDDKKNTKLIKGIRVSASLFVSCMLFVDDVLIF